MNKTTLSLGIFALGGALLTGAILLKKSGPEMLEPKITIPAQNAEMQEAAAITLEQIKAQLFKYDSVSGNYLTGRFAQRHHDWSTAASNIDKVIDKTQSESPSLIKRAMVLEMGAGEYDKAFAHAHELEKIEVEPGALAYMFLAGEAFKAKDYQKAADYIRKMPEGSLSTFIMPLLYSWTSAALGVYDTQDLNQNTVHIYHAILIADYMNQHDYIETLLDRSMKAVNITAEDIERIGDIYAHIGNSEKAIELYRQILEVMPENLAVTEKIERVKNNENEALFDRIESPEQGIAEALLDMARILSRDYSDESARVFGSMAQYLNPDDSDIHMLLAVLAARNERYNDAVAIYKSIKPEDVNFLEAKRNAADLLEEDGRTDEALTQLQQLVTAHDDVDAKIQIGDIYRRQDDFKSAINAYNKAAKSFKDTLPDDYWHLYYVRGMAYEQDGNWQKAEADLKAALAFRPDNPFVLNYLGYAWADQGKNLEEALGMIRKATELRPQDGYIKDSLGWVLYKMNRFEEAVPHLETAVALEPYDPIINDHLGDAYWQVGRKLEARFQWSRAQNQAEDEELILSLESKMLKGMDRLEPDTSDLRQNANSVVDDTQI